MSRWPINPDEVALDLVDQDQRDAVDALMERDAGFRTAVAQARRTAVRLGELPDDVWNAATPPPLDSSFLPARTATRRPRRRRWVLAPAAVALGAAAILTISAVRDPAAPAPLRVALASVAQTPGDVELTVQGPTARLIAHRLPVTDEHHHYEAWVGDATGAMVSMGTFRVDPTGEADVEMPVAVDLSKYSAVDISLESDDGNPAHSTQSVFHANLPPTPSA